MKNKCKCGRFKSPKKPACKDCLNRAEKTAQLMIEVYGENRAPVKIIKRGNLLATFCRTIGLLNNTALHRRVMGEK